jgi:large subunit ribosomal protein L32
MAVPKKKTSRSRRNMRRSHDGLVRTYASTCPNCGVAILRHRACGSCGHYRGRQVVKGTETAL